MLKALQDARNYGKGIDYSRHVPEQVVAERAARLGQIRALVAAIGREHLPPEFLESVDSGSVASDMTGRHCELLRTYFRGGRTP